VPKFKHSRHSSQVFSFGATREAYNKVYLPSKKHLPDIAVPGPGSYQSLKPIGFNARKASLHPKLNRDDPEKIEKRKGVPGPGYYQDVLTLNKFGKYCVSNYK
jgi:hypothetical protein